MIWKENYNLWKKHRTSLPASLKVDLENLESNQEHLQSAFNGELSFGTAGLRGIMGVGSNRMNLINITRATLALACYLKKYYTSDDLKTRGVVIGHDARYHSAEFTTRAAQVLANEGINVWLFFENRVTPTPIVSFVIQKSNCVAGIVITASHNAKQYNGFKVYGANGAQYLPDVTSEIADYYNTNSDKPFLFKYNEQHNDLINELDKSKFKQTYFEVMRNNFYDDRELRFLKITYSNLSGAGRNWSPILLQKCGFNVSVVNEQYEYDPNFTTCPSPNPEIKSVFDLSIKLANVNHSDIIIINDGDADRVGMAVLNEKNEYQLLTGNETAPILFYYVLTKYQNNNKLPTDSVIYSTYVSTHLTDLIARDYNVKIKKTLTGFKWICNQMLADMKDNNHPIFAYEEACGFAVAPEVKDKDGVHIALLMAEAANYFKNRNLTLVQVLNKLYEKYGYFYCDSLHFNFASSDNSMVLMKQKMARIRQINIATDLKAIGIKSVHIRDFNQISAGIRQQNFLKITLDENSFVAIRPSGTEPMLKLYFVCYSKISLAQAHATFEQLKVIFKKWFI